MRNEKMTVPKLEGLIECGRGIGTGDRYQPWISIKRGGTSKTSNQSYTRMPGLTRHCCFLSRGEYALAHVLRWLGVEDVREQYPLWPWAHRSPYCAVETKAKRPDHPGMVTVAKDAGIRIFNYPGLQIPAILTIDLLVTIRRDIDQPPQLLGISCKPKDLYLRATSTERLRERLELDRRYCNAASIPHLLLHPEQIPSVLVRQLEWLAPRASRLELESLRTSPAYRRFVDRLRKHIYDTPAHRVIGEAGHAVSWVPKVAERHARTAIWCQDIDIDLIAPVLLHEPLRLGGVALKHEIRRRIFPQVRQCH